VAAGIQVTIPNRFTAWTIASCAIVLSGSGIAIMFLRLNVGYVAAGGAYLIFLTMAADVFSRARQAYRRDIRNTTQPSR